MGQVLHRCATTTEAIRRAIQNSQASIRSLARQYGVNPKTVAKWKQRKTVQDQPMGPKLKQSTILSNDEEAVIVAFRKQTLLPLDDCLYALQEIVPHLTRSSLHRCLQRHGISRLPETRDKPAKQRFKQYPIGYFHLDIAEVRTDEGKLKLFVAIDRTSKFTLAKVYHKANRPNAVAFLRYLIGTVPYKINTILTDNGIQFANRAKDRHAFPLLFDRICHRNGIDHRRTKPRHPWTNGQVERMIRTLKEATVHRYFYASHMQFLTHLDTYLIAYNFAKRLKRLSGSTPYEFVHQQWLKEPNRFVKEPFHLIMGLNTIENSTFHVWVLGKMGVHSCPNAVFFPTSKALVNTVPATKAFWQVAPLCASPQTPVNTLDKAACLGLIISVGVWMVLQKTIYFAPLCRFNFS